jgi:ribosomal protein S1
VVKEGNSVEVYVISVDKEKERVSLSLKKTIPEPWENIGERIHVGDIIEGTVARIASFGAFVEIEKGVDGLVHISQISSKRISKVSDVLKVGDRIKAKVMELNVQDKKISLSIKEAVEEENKNESIINNQEQDNITIGEIVNKE